MNVARNGEINKVEMKSSASGSDYVECTRSLGKWFCNQGVKPYIWPLSLKLYQTGAANSPIIAENIINTKVLGPFFTSTNFNSGNIGSDSPTKTGQTPSPTTDNPTKSPIITSAPVASPTNNPVDGSSNCGKSIKFDTYYGGAYAFSFTKEPTFTDMINAGYSNPLCSDIKVKASNSDRWGDCVVHTTDNNACNCDQHDPITNSIDIDIRTSSIIGTVAINDLTDLNTPGTTYTISTADCPTGTDSPTTKVPTTKVPTTKTPTTATPTTATPTTKTPTTGTTVAVTPTTANPTTATPTTKEPTTKEPTTKNPTVANCGNDINFEIYYGGPWAFSFTKDPTLNDIINAGYSNAVCSDIKVKQTGANDWGNCAEHATDSSACNCNQNSAISDSIDIDIKNSEITGTVAIAQISDIQSPGKTYVITSGNCPTPTTLTPTTATPTTATPTTATPTTATPTTTTTTEITTTEIATTVTSTTETATTETATTETATTEITTTETTSTETTTIETTTTEPRTTETTTTETTTTETATTETTTTETTTKEPTTATPTTATPTTATPTTVAPTTKEPTH